METKKEPTVWYILGKLEKKYNELLTIHMEAQLFSYILLSIFCLTDLSNYPVAVFVGKVLFLVSMLILIAPVNRIFYNIARFTNNMFERSLEILSLGAIIMQGILPAVMTKRNFFFIVLLVWVALYFFIRAYHTYKLIGLYRLLSFGLAGIGLLEYFSGQSNIIYQIISVAGLALSVPAIDEMMNTNPSEMSD